MTAGQWAELRQVGFAALDHEAAVRTATDLLALGPGFGDPLLAAMGLADFTAPVGPDTYVEVLAPVTPDHSVARWLRRVGGASGWVLSTQVPSLAGVRERAAALGGNCEAGPASGAGWRVRAEIPVREAAAGRAGTRWLSCTSTSAGPGTPAPPGSRGQ